MHCHLFYMLNKFEMPSKIYLFSPDIIHMMNETRPSPFLLLCFIVNANGREKIGVRGWLGMSLVDLLGSPFLGLLLIEGVGQAHVHSDI